MAKVSPSPAEVLADALQAYIDAEPEKGARAFVLMLISEDGSGGVLSSIPTEDAQQAMRDYLDQRTKTIN